MAKKTLSKCFLILAGIILVGHAVFPHHHHLPACNLVNTVVAHNHGHNDLMPFSHSHQHEGSTPGQCVLEQTVIVRPNTSRIDPQVNSGTPLDGDLNFSLLFTACLNNNDYTYIPISGIFLRTDYQIPFYFRLLPAISLRGPPIA